MLWKVDADGVAEVPKVRCRTTNPAIRLRSGGGYSDVQSLGLHQSGLWFLDPHR